MFHHVCSFTCNSSNGRQTWHLLLSGSGGMVYELLFGWQLSAVQEDNDVMDDNADINKEWAVHGLPSLSIMFVLCMFVPENMLHSNTKLEHCVSFHAIISCDPL